MTTTHQFDEYRGQWELARREAEAGSKGSAVFSLVMLMTFIECNAVTAGSPPPGFPEWLLDDIRKIFRSAIRNGAGLDKGFHLTARPGRNLMANAMRDMEISVLMTMFESPEKLADHAEALGLPPPKPGEPWTADSLKKAAEAHNRRIKSGLLFIGKG